MAFSSSFEKVLNTISLFVVETKFGNTSIICWYRGYLDFSCSVLNLFSEKLFDFVSYIFLKSKCMHTPLSSLIALIPTHLPAYQGSIQNQKFLTLASRYHSNDMKRAFNSFFHIFILGCIIVRAKKYTRGDQSFLENIGSNEADLKSWQFWMFEE